MKKSPSHKRDEAWQAPRYHPDSGKDIPALSGITVRPEYLSVKKILSSEVKCRQRSVQRQLSARGCLSLDAGYDPAAASSQLFNI